MSSLSLRAWALAQLGYETLGLVRSRLTLDEFGGVFRSLAVGCILRGHADIRMCYGVDADQYPVLGNPVGLADDGNVLRAARDAAERYASIGRAKGGYLASFVLACVAHLDGCEHCQSAVCAEIRRQFHDHEVTSRLLTAAGIDALSNRLLAGLPPETRQRLRSVRNGRNHT